MEHVDIDQAAPTGPVATALAPTAPAPHPTTLRMQILTTEHWSLFSSRSLAWNESFSRAV